MPDARDDLIDPADGGRTLWLDPSAGVAGDMLLAALVDAGVPLDLVRSAVQAVIPDTVRLVASTVSRAGMRATAVTVELLVQDQPERPWPVIRSMLAVAALDEGVRSRATAVFGALATAEATVHGVDPDQVHFHEVGGWDSIADVVGVCAALVALDVDTVLVGELALGSGTVGTRHGLMPVPVPAVLELARGWPVTSGGTGELATPTGVALLTTLGTGRGPLPAMTPDRVGVGAGSRDRADRPNVVRAVLGRPAPAEPWEPADPWEPAGPLEPMVLVETNVDDLDPRVWPGVLDDLLAAGAVDAWLTPVLMKKGRPGHVLAALVAPDTAAAVRRVMLERTSALGVRQSPVRRDVLDRCWLPVTLDQGEVAVKIGYRAGRILHVQPEFDDVAALAAASGVPVRQVLAAAGAAAVTAGLVPGAPVPAHSRPDRPARTER